MMDADDMLREAIYEEFNEVIADPRCNHEDEIHRLVTMVESMYWQLVNAYEPEAETWKEGTK